MTADPTNPAALRPQELEAVYAISRSVASAVNIDSALDEIKRLTRPVFIFDNMVLYLKAGEDSLEPTYARAIGRGRSHEAELSWGDAVAYDAFKSTQPVIRMERTNDYPENRTQLWYSLGLSLNLESETIGSLVFIRFGGPPFEDDQIRLAEFIASHVTQLLGHKQLVQRIVNLEAERRLIRLQEDFIATISHELLTPLGFIKGYATTLLREDTTWEDQTRKEFLSIIDEEADRLRELLDNIMDSSRLQSRTLRMSYQPVRLDTFLKDVSMRATSRHENLSIDLQLDTPIPPIQLDPSRLAQVFDNLLSNATKYAPGAPVVISLNSNDSLVHISVRDSGPGIGPEHLDQLFKRFYRVPTSGPRVRGTGLGLFICRQIINAHEGEIYAESVLGEGTTFHINFPIERKQIADNITFQESRP